MRKPDSELFIEPTRIPAFVNQQHIEGYHRVEEDIQAITKEIPKR